MRYVLDKKAFISKMTERGYKSVLNLAAKSGVHRNTINLYLKGKGVMNSSFERLSEFLGVDPMEIAMPVSRGASDIDELDEIMPVVRSLVEKDLKLAVILLGSRAAKKGRAHADWDIGITRAEMPIGGEEYLDLRAQVSDISDGLSHGVDLINLDVAPRWFLEGIKYEPVFLGGDREGFVRFQGVLDGIRRKGAA